MKKITYSLWAIVLLALVSIQAINTDGGYAIEFNIKNYANTEMILAYHSGSQQYISDTLTAVKPGQFIAKGDEELSPGMYIAFFPSIGKSFEFLINKGEQHFKLTTDSQNLVAKMSVKGSSENDMFFKYLNYLTSQRRERDGMTALLADLKKEADINESKIKEVEVKVKALDEVVVAYQKNILEKHPNSFTAGIIKINTPIDVPEHIRKNDVASFYYYKKHFFDNINLNDERFLRTPMLAPKIDLYLSDKVTVPHPDSILMPSSRRVLRSRCSAAPSPRPP